MKQVEELKYLGHVGNVRKRCTEFDKDLYNTYASELTVSEKHGKTKQQHNVKTTFWIIGFLVTVAIFINSKSGQENIKRLISDVDVCSPNPCLNDGKCVDKFNDFSCQCKQWFSGETCEIYNDPCAKHQCRNGGTCNALPDRRYTCSCPPGIDGIFCESPHH